MIRDIKIIMLNTVLEYYKKRVLYCCYKSKVYSNGKKTHKSVYWTNRAAKYFIKECDVALKIVELAS